MLLFCFTKSRSGVRKAITCKLGCGSAHRLQRIEAIPMSIMVEALDAGFFEGPPKWKRDDDSHPTFCMLIIDDCLSLPMMMNPSSGLVNTCIKHRHVADAQPTQNPPGGPKRVSLRPRLAFFPVLEAWHEASLLRALIHDTQHATTSCNATRSASLRPHAPGEHPHAYMMLDFTHPACAAFSWR